MSTQQPLQAIHLNAHIPSKTHPVYLRSITLADAPDHARLLSTPEKPFAQELSEKAIKAQLQDMAVPTIFSPETGRAASGPKRINMVVCYQPSPDGEAQIIGLGGYGGIKDWVRDGRAVRAGDTGVLLDPAFRRKGLAAEVMRLSIDWAFTKVADGGPQFDLVTITTDETNIAMIKLTEEKLHLKGGVLRPHEFEKDKQEKYWEFDASDWKALGN